MKNPLRWSLHSDPHIIARLSDDVTVCFDWIGRDNEVVSFYLCNSVTVIVSCSMIQF